MKGLLLLAVGTSLALAAGAGGGAGPCGFGPGIRADGADLCSTADADQKEELRALARAARDGQDLARVVIDYPQDGSIFPPEILAPTFLWHDDSAAERWLVEIALEDGAVLQLAIEGTEPPRGEIDPRCVAVTNEIYEPTPYQASARAWKPDPELWRTIKERSVVRPARIAFHGIRDVEPRVVSAGSVALSTSADAAGAPIFYRDVPLMPSATADGVIKPLDQTAQPLIAWRLRDLGRPESRVMLRDLPTCANCHSFSADGSTLAMDVDGPQGDKGAYTIVPVRPEVRIAAEDVFTWNAFPGKPHGHHTLGFMSQISPDGRHVVSTVNERLYVRNFWDYRFSQVFYPTRGILASYSRESRAIAALPGADDPAFVHCNATWTPDGKQLVFARAPAVDPYGRDRPLATHAGDPNETPMRYDLYRMPFDEGRGGEAVPIAGASQNGMSNSFPKVSPDGKWIVFVQSRNGLLMRPDGKLWIVPLTGGEPRLLRANQPRMNSWHSFSPNGRWLVFSSKGNTPYTQLFLTHIDEEGNDSPAVLIENSTAANRAANIPEFVDVAYDDFRSISVPAVNHYALFARGNELARAGRTAEALAAYEEALAGEHRDWRVNDWRIHDSLSKVLLQAGDEERALEHVRRSLELNPYNAEMHGNLGYILARRGELSLALEHLDLAQMLQPENPRTWYNRATLRLQLGDAETAALDFGEALRTSPEYAEAWLGRGMARRALGRLSRALPDFDEAVRLNPNNPTALYLRARTRHELGDAKGAAADVEAALRVAPPDWANAAEVRALAETLRGAEAE